MIQDLWQYLQDIEYDFLSLTEVFPEITALKEIPQNPEFHGEGNVFVHTKNVCTVLKEQKEWECLSQKEKGILMLSAFFHDYGKLKCTREEEGRITSKKHTVTGAKMVRELLYVKYADSFLLSFFERESITALVRYHGLPPLFMEKKSPETQLIQIRETVDFRLLYLLSKADILGRISQHTQKMLEMAEYFKEYAQELGCYDEVFQFQNEYTRLRFYQGARVWRQDRLYDETQFPVYMMAGLPLAGKDTYVSEHLRHLPVISLDEIRSDCNISPGKHSKAVAAKATERAKEYLRRKEPFVWNATNIVPDTRRKLYSLFEAYGASVHLIYVEAPYRELLHRNEIRSRRIPEAILMQMIKKLDLPEPAECYRVIYSVGK